MSTLTPRERRELGYPETPDTNVPGRWVFVPDDLPPHVVEIGTDVPDGSRVHVETRFRAMVRALEHAAPRCDPLGVPVRNRGATFPPTTHGDHDRDPLLF